MESHVYTRVLGGTNIVRRLYKSTPWKKDWIFQTPSILSVRMKSAYTKSQEILDWQFYKHWYYQDMPKALERKLRAAGRKKGFKGERLERYVYGSEVMQEHFRKKRRKK